MCPFTWSRNSSQSMSWMISPSLVISGGFIIPQPPTNSSPAGHFPVFKFTGADLHRWWLQQDRKVLGSFCPKLWSTYEKYFFRAGAGGAELLRRFDQSTQVISGCQVNITFSLNLSAWWSALQRGCRRWHTAARVRSVNSIWRLRTQTSGVSVRAFTPTHTYTSSVFRVSFGSSPHV